MTVPKFALVGVLLAIAITTTMDAIGLLSFSALPLAALLGIFWYLEKLPRRNLGFVWGRWCHYGLALAYPLLVVGTIALIATAGGALDLSHTDWRKTWLNLGLLTVSTFLIAIITEEGFFRGWLSGVSRTSGPVTRQNPDLDQSRILAVALVGLDPAERL